MEPGCDCHSYASCSCAWIELLEDRLKSRVLYPNPVVIMVTANTQEAHEKRNAMTLSWITPVDNRASFVFSVNKRRFSASLLASHRAFALSVPAEDMQATVLQIGKGSGARRDKFDEIQGLQLVEPSSMFIKSTVAHLECRVVDIRDLVTSENQDEDGGHYIVVAKIGACRVHPMYWDGKNFAPRRPSAPRYLTFLGSQRFGFVATS